MKHWYVLLILCSCNTDPCYYRMYDWGFNYETNPNHTTKYGIKVDTSGQNVNPLIFDMVDQMAQEVEQCLDPKFTCKRDDTPPKICKGCLIVKIPNDWSFSNKDSRQQVLSDRAPDEACKNSDPPCYWRAGLQDGYIIITTPNLFLFKDPLIKHMTRCDDVWYTPELSKCARSNVGPDWLEEWTLQ